MNRVDSIERQDSTQQITTVQLMAESAHSIGAMFRQMGDFIDSLGSDSVEVREVIYTRDSDRDGWPVWYLTAYVSQFKKDSE